MVGVILFETAGPVSEKDAGFLEKAVLHLQGVKTVYCYLRFNCNKILIKKQALFCV